MIYLLMPAFIKAKDGNIHYVGVSQLMRLYKVTPNECLVYKPRRVRPIQYARMIKLYPREDGNYEQANL